MNKTARKRPPKSLPAREELRLLLKEHGILHARPDQPVQLRDGSGAPWMFYSWGVSLTGRGAELAGRCLSERLDRCFESRQLATYGQTGLPLMMACLLHGRGRYRGLAVRQERKAYGSMRRIDGHGDRSQPVVLIDDSIVSGTSMLEAIAALQEEGYQVEGCLGLLTFPWRGGVERLQALGFRVEVLYDVWQDLEMPQPVYQPVHLGLIPRPWPGRALRSGLHPAVAARRIAESYLKDGTLPRPPRSLDRVYDGRGGVFVSFRLRESDHRIARDGFWHFEPGDAEPCRDLVLATLKTLRDSRTRFTPELLAECKICATFFGPMERIAPADLDFANYGIVCRSRAVDARMGGALPNTEVFNNDIHQYRHARWTNARILEYEPHDLLRHTLDKRVEPGEYWLPFGFPAAEPRMDWTRDPSIGERLTRRAQEIMKALEEGREPAGTPVPADLIPAPLFGLAVTLWKNGLVSCGVAYQGDLEECLRQATRFAFREDPRLPARKPSFKGLGVSVSVLHDREWLGEGGPELAGKLRPGLDSVVVVQGEKTGMLLNFVGTHYNWGRADLARELMRKARIPGGACGWAMFPTATWLRRGKQQWRLSYGFPAREDAPRPTPEALKKTAGLLAGYLHTHLQPDGIPTYALYPVTGQRAVRGTPPRHVHGLWALERTGHLLDQPAWRQDAREGLRRCLDDLQQGQLRLWGQPPSLMADSLLLAACAPCSELHESARPLADRLAASLQPDGRVSDRPDATGLTADLDFATGATLLALAWWWKARGTRPPDLGPQLRWFRRRFSIAHPWGMVGWHTQAWAALAEVTGDRTQAEFALEMADWALDWQHRVSGAFLADLDPDGFSFHTGFLTEGMAAAAQAAAWLQDRRSPRYHESCLEALRFMERLLIRPEDTFCMRDPDRSVGGVRGSLCRCEVRVDYVSHTLMAVLGVLTFPGGA